MPSKLNTINPVAEVTRGERILWLCVFAERFLMQSSLKGLSLLMSGMPSIMEAPAFTAHQLALFNLRRLDLGMDSEDSIERAIGDYEDFCKRNKRPRDYAINAVTRDFQATSMLGSSRCDCIEAALKKPLEYKPQDGWTADPNEFFTVNIGTLSARDERVIDRIGQTKPAPPQHAMARKRRTAIRVSFAALVKTAADMDAYEKKHLPFDRLGNWEKRLRAARLTACTSDGLVDTDDLVLVGSKHMIGVPSVGKTSVLMVLAKWMADNGYRLMLVFPSIEVSLQYLSTLEHHGVRVAPLTGQSSRSRTVHAQRLAQSIAGRSAQGGFSQTAPAARFLGNTCLLQSYEVTPPHRQSVPWPFGKAPCYAVSQPEQMPDEDAGQARCPLFSQCGLRLAERELVEAHVWVGHIRSTDTRMSGYTTGLDMQYFEYIARYFDMVVFDEADGVQSLLDDAAASSLKLLGHPEALLAEWAPKMLNEVMGQNNHHLKGKNAVITAVNAVSAQAPQFYSRLQSMLDSPDKKQAVTYFNTRLLTPLRMITEIMAQYYGPINSSGTVHGKRAGVIAKLLEDAAAGAFRRSMFTKKRPKWYPSQRLEQALGMTPAALIQIYEDMREALWILLHTDSENDVDEQTVALSSMLNTLCFGNASVMPATRAALDMLPTVTLMIGAYKRLVYHARHLQIGNRYLAISETSSSDMLRRLTPTGVLATIYGLKYTLKPAEDGRTGAYRIDTEYTAIGGLPRMMMLNFHKLYSAESKAAGRQSDNGPAVLSVSATSFLEDSPTFHVDCGPHYVLLRAPQPKTDDVTAADSTWAFTPIPDTRAGRGGRMLKVSGDYKLHLETLSLMVDALLKDGQRGRLANHIQSHDVLHGEIRRAALIVNSYEQALHLKRHIDSAHPEFRNLTRAVVRDLESVNSREHFVTPAGVEGLGDDPTWQILILPMMAIGRGVNIIRTFGKRNSQATIGTVYFLTRPHPTIDDSQLLLGLLGRAGVRFARNQFDASATLADMAAEHQAAKRDLWREIGFLMRQPLVSSALPPHLYRAFVANQIVMILQTIGRATRGNRPAQVFFVDAAWAPKTAKGLPDAANTSLLIAMHELLQQGMNSSSAALAQLYQSAFGEFFQPLSRIQGVLGMTPSSAGPAGAGSASAGAASAGGATQSAGTAPATAAAPAATNNGSDDDALVDPDLLLAPPMDEEEGDEDDLWFDDGTDEGSEE